MNRTATMRAHQGVFGLVRRSGCLRSLSIGVVLVVGCSLEPEGPNNDNDNAVGADEIRGFVHDGEGPVNGAVVRVQTTQVSTTTSADGSFIFNVSEFLDQPEPLRLTGWAPGYYIVGPTEARPGDSDVSITLTAHAVEDNPDYQWLPSQRHAGEGENQGCAECHSSADGSLQFTLPVDEWLMDAHSQAAVNPRFLTMYAGTDVNGNRSPGTQYANHPDYGRIPLPPSDAKPYYGPGFKLDFPSQFGSCAACHTPVAAVDAPYQVDPAQVSGVAAEGISCDFCHKVWDVRLDESTGLPLANMPGVLSFEFRRPPQDHQFFAGPFDDVAPGEDTYSAIQQTSQYCAPCHFGIFWDVIIYNSFGEWLNSPYSDPQTGRTCQDCHMPPTGATHFAHPDQGGLARDPQTIFSHRMPGAADVELLRNAVTMTVAARAQGDSIVVQVDITNDQTGHHVPTDSPLRHLILLVSARDVGGAGLVQLEGSVVPEWCGVGDAADGNYAGLPGKAFAKVLEELWTEVSPTGAYWNPTAILSDNRIAALATDSSAYTFAAPGGGNVSIEVRLLFRRAFKDLMDLKGWAVPDIVMEEVDLTVSP